MTRPTATTNSSDSSRDDHRSGRRPDPYRPLTVIVSRETMNQSTMLDYRINSRGRKQTAAIDEAAVFTQARIPKKRSGLAPHHDGARDGLTAASDLVWRACGEFEPHNPTCRQIGGLARTRVEHCEAAALEGCFRDCVKIVDAIERAGHYQVERGTEGRRRDAIAFDREIE